MENSVLLKTPTIQQFVEQLSSPLNPSFYRMSRFERHKVSIKKIKQYIENHCIELKDTDAYRYDILNEIHSV
jgi:hypothetical protein